MGPEAAELVAGGTHLRKLSLFGSRLGDPGAQRIAAIMVAETLTGLLELELAGCNISKAGMHVLFDTLQTGVAPALEVLPCFLHWTVYLRAYRSHSAPITLLSCVCHIAVKIAQALSDCHKHSGIMS